MNKKKWIIILIVVFIIPVIMMVYLVGCRQTRLENKLKKVLRDRYDEKFEVVDMYVLYGGLDSWPNKRYIATCRPVDNPDVVFEVDFWDYDIENGRDNYFHRYVAQQVENILKEDLKQFFPDCYVHCMGTGIGKPQNEYIFSDKSLDKIIENTEVDYNYRDIYIYINSDVGSLQKFEEEYKYFSSAEDNKIGEASIWIFFVDSSLYEEVKEYYQCHWQPKGEFYEKTLKSNYMFASFVKTVPAYIENKGGLKEYISLRKGVENNNE